MWDFILNQIPWPVQMVLIGIPIAIVFGIVGNIIGWEHVRKFILPALAVIGAIGLLGRARQQGYRDREERGERETTDAILQAEAARADADALNAEPERLRQTDGHKRPNKPRRV